MTRAQLFIGACLVLRVAIAAGDEPVSARGLYDRGISHYKLGEFEAAVDDFKAAYALKPSVVLLFNLAQAHRQLGEDRRALFFYRAFVREAPPSAARTDAERLVVLLARELPPSPASPAEVVAPEVPPLTKPVVQPKPRAQPEPRDMSGSAFVDVSAPLSVPPRMTRRGAVALVASTATIGAAFIAGGAGLWIHAARTADALEHPGLASALDTPWDAAHRALYDEGRASSDAGLALFVVGGVALTTSIISAIVYRRELGRTPRLGQGLKGGTWTF